MSLRYDVFLSYSQRDHNTVAWLHRVLRDYWVPGRKRRAIFLDRMSMGAGVLDEGLVVALRNSRFLAVCCSANARASEWVDKEVEEFLKTHTDRDVLICAVGPTKEIAFPRSIEALQQRRGNLRWPDLRGYPEARSKPEQKPAVEEALSLLADILGFAGKDALVDNVARGRARRIRIGAGAAAVLVAAALGIWVWLHYTTAGALYLARQRVLYAAATEIRDDPALARTAHALGVLGRRGDVESFAATVKDHDFRGLVLAAGYAALPEPECARASAALEGLQRASALMGARSLLLLQKRCGGAWMLRARPDPLTEDAMLRWGRALAETGHENEARALLSRPDFPAKDRLPLAAAIAIGSGTEFILDEQDLMAWSGEDDASSRLYEATKELERLDLGARLADTGSRRLMQHALTALTELGRAGFGNWNHQQRLAAHLAGAGDDAASTVLGDVPLTALTSPSEAPGLAWRALALHRLGQQSESLAAFEQAEVAGRTLTPQTRSWREWFDIATASALAEEWRRACRAAEAPGDEATRFGLRCWVIELWAHRDQPQSRW